MDPTLYQEQDILHPSRVNGVTKAPHSYNHVPDFSAALSPKAPDPLHFVDPKEKEKPMDSRIPDPTRSVLFIYYFLYINYVYIFFIFNILFFKYQVCVS